MAIHDVPPAPGRSRRRRLARAAVPLGAAGWAALEIWLMVLVAEATSGLLVVLLLAVGFAAGAMVIRRAGMRAWRDLAEALSRQAAQKPEASAGRSRSGVVLPMLGGALLMVPGFASDVLGLLCLFPPTRALLRRVLPRGAAAPAGSYRDAYQQARIHRPDGRVVQGEVVDRGEPEERWGNGDRER